ncbi:putative apoptosis inhibitor 5-A [Apostichopus japonicus]|uniref:Putative apoptosis inhibitor 5-A n=1 Tax=Stichopus japonicus TaxID=307972 RepID=A0A2G8KCH1_STIJA|nr:putative apoptosis inhibitor 5-A [Apostichopus japonicus]
MRGTDQSHVRYRSIECAVLNNRMCVLINRIAVPFNGMCDTDQSNVLYRSIECAVPINRMSTYLRLQYFARGVQSSMKQLRLALKGKAGAQLKTEENKIKVVALRITSNINTLIKDLMHNPPSYKSNIVLSWKPIQKQGVATSPETAKKRPHITPITFESDKKVAAGGKKSRGTPYSPPGGKYSNKAGRAPTGGDANYGNWGSSNYGNYNRNKGRGRNRGRFY